MAITTEIDVWQGDIAELEVDAIIVPANESLFMTAPVARAVKRVAGEDVESDAVHQGPAAPGSAVVTGGGLLASPYLIHAVAVGHELRREPEALYAALHAAFDAAGRLGLGRVAVAPIGCERGVFSADEAASALADVLRERAASGAPAPASLVVAVGSAAEAATFRSAIETLGAASR